MSGDRRLQDDRRPEDERQLEDRLRRFRVPVDPGGAWEAVEYRAQEEERAAQESLPLTARVDERAGVWKRALAPRMSGRRRTSGLRIAVFASLVVVLMAAATIGTLEAVEHFGRGTDILVFTDDINIGTATSTGTTPAKVWDADGGIWQPVTVTVGGAPVRGLVIDPNDASVLYALTDQGLFKSTDAAANWVQLFAEAALLIAVDPASPSTLYACAEDWEQATGENRVLLRSDDGGANWQVVDDSVLSTDGSPTKGAQGFVFDTSTSPSTVYYYGFGLHESTDGGATWTDLIAPQGSPDDPNHELTDTPVEAVALDPAHPGTIYAVTHYDTALLVRSNDGGATWEELPSGITGQPLDMGMGIPGEPSIRLGIGPGDASRLYQSVLGDQSGVLAYTFAGSTDQGQTWTVLDGAEAERARAVLEAGPGASADSIDALMALTGGALPSPPDWMPVGSHVIGAAADDPPALYAFGGSGVYKSTDAGATWNPANSGLGYAWVRQVVVDPASPSTIYVCTEQGIGKSIDGGTTWDTIYAGSAGQVIVAPSYTSVLYAWTSAGLLRSDDGGASWDARACTGLPDLAGNVAGGPQWMAGDEFSFAWVAADAPDTLYVYDNYRSGDASLYRSTDGGDSWEPCAAGGATVLGSAVTAPSDPSIVYAAGTLTAPEVKNDVGQSTGLLTSEDGGVSWTYQAAPAWMLGLAVGAEDPSTLYGLCGEREPWTGTLVEGSTLYRSSDAGGTWQEIEFEHVGYIEWIAADPRVPGVLYAASLSDKDGDKVFRTEAHFYRSLDEGATWKELSGEWTLDRTKISPQVQTWCEWSFAADLEGDRASEIAFYALKHMGTDALPVYNLYKWVPGD